MANGLYIRAHAIKQQMHSRFRGNFPVALQVTAVQILMTRSSGDIMPLFMQVARRQNAVGARAGIDEVALRTATMCPRARTSTTGPRDISLAPELVLQVF